MTKKSSTLSQKKPLPLVSTGFWLLKSEPTNYSIDDLARDQKTLWTGVRNYQARNFMTDSMRPGDRFLFYHSNAEIIGCFGSGKILRAGVADPEQFNKKGQYYDPKATSDVPIWRCAEVGFERKFPFPVTLAWIRSQPQLCKMVLLQTGQRLSVQPLQPDEFKEIENYACSRDPR